jgi:hypothetical protein
MTPLAATRSFHQEVDEEGLTAGRALHLCRRGGQETAAEHLIQVGYPRGNTPRVVLDAARAVHAGRPDTRIELKTVGADSEEVLAGNVVGAAHLQDFHFSLCRKPLASGAQAYDTVGNGELGVAQPHRAYTPISIAVTPQPA